MKILINSLPCTKCGKLAFEDFSGSGRWFECDDKNCNHYFDIKEYYALNLTNNKGGLK